MSAPLTQAAIRALGMSEAEYQDKLGLCSDQVRGKIENEVTTINWVTLTCLIWHEQGTLEEVLAYIKERCEEQTEVPA